MSRIVVGYDASPAAQVAIDWVAERSTRESAAVEFVTVTGMLGADHARAVRGLDAAERRLHDSAPGTPVESRHVGGSMPSTLVEDARFADLLVIGVHRGRPLRAALSGWMPTRLTARAHTPVCLVPDTWTANGHPVTVGLDDDDSSDAAILFAAREADIGGGRLRVVHAWSMPTPTMEGAVSLLASPLQVKEDHRQILKDAVRRVRAEFPDVEIEERLVAASPGGALCALAAESSMVVIGTHRRGVFEAGIIGSVAIDVIGQVDTPVCVVPPPAPH